MTLPDMLWVLLLAESTPAPNTSIFGLVVQLVAVLIWPAVVTVLLITQRRVINRLFSALALLAESANKIKVWQVEIERDIDHEVGKAAEAAQVKINARPAIAKTEIVAAARIEALVGKLPDTPSKKNILNSVRLRMLGLAEEYDSLRASMPSSQQRTVEMNRVAAQMRALGVAAIPWLKEFSRDQSSAGVRLCAITILQMAPSDRYLSWLEERFKSERPFIFYQASIALMEAVRTFGSSQKPNLLAVINSALDHLKAFTNGAPDRNSLNVLSAALEELRNPTNDVTAHNDLDE